jgi:hypothetical protein
MTNLTVKQMLVLSDIEAAGKISKVCFTDVQNETIETLVKIGLVSKDGNNWIAK